MSSKKQVKIKLSVKFFTLTEIKYLKEFLNTNVSNTELWVKLKRYFINEDEKLKEELQDLLREFEYNVIV